MGKSKKRKKDRSKRKKRPLGAKRLAAIDRIERAKKRQPQPVASKAAPRPAPVVRTDPELVQRIAEARRMGLSVADDTSADRLTRLLARHELAVAYARRVWGALTNGADTVESPSEDQFRHLAAGLFDDGRMADAVVTAQEQHVANPRSSLHRDASYRTVADTLREEFGERLPKRSLLSRLLGR